MSWKLAGSDVGKVMLARRHAAYVFPLVAWGLLESVELLEAYGGNEYLVGGVFPFLFGLLYFGLRPLARASVEGTARWQGCRLEDLEPGRGLRGLAGLARREPWWVTWSVLACWTSLPVALAVTVGGLVGGPGFLARRPCWPWSLLSTCRLGGLLLAFLLAPVVRWLAGAEPARSAGEESRVG